MASNHFGTHFRITTWGESHGKGIGVVIDGCPPNLPLSAEEIDTELALRAPGKTPFTSPRKEADRVEILSGLFEGKTTGAPIALQILNTDANPKAYDPIRHLIRPGHAQESYLKKYGVFDYRGGGRASARETAARVAAGAVAKKILNIRQIKLTAYLKGVGEIECPLSPNEVLERRSEILTSPLFCPDLATEEAMKGVLAEAIKEGDSLGGVVELIMTGDTAGLGDPIYEKLEALLGYAMMTLPATKGFEVGSGFACVKMKGSVHNDKRYAGGILGGIATGDPITIRVAFKPTSSIRKGQMTTDLEGEPALLTPPPNSRHDPCVAIRATRVVEAMGALVMADRIVASQESFVCS